ncbi:hypothetical protein C0993_001873 [Termitomyces sp. T159_Od127]|nr:hypothetical protein C0993_001873 [Termitomyces sp. T159_Od127]
MLKAGFSAACKAARVATGDKTKNYGSNTVKQFMQLIRPSEKVYLVEEAKLQKLQNLTTTANTQPAPSAFAGLVTDNLPTNSPNNVKWEDWMATVKE